MHFNKVTQLVFITSDGDDFVRDSCEFCSNTFEALKIIAFFLTFLTPPSRDYGKL